MKALVTGGCGFIGSHLVQKLLGMECEVHNVDKLTYAANPEFLKEADRNPLYKFHKLDLANRLGLNIAVRQIKPDVVFHLAAESHVDNSISDADDFVSTNVVGTYNLLEAVKNGGHNTRFVHVSTDEVYGSIREGSFTENTRYCPRSPYSATKAASDHLVYAWHITYGLDTIITHCTNNYGPNQQTEKLIPTVITKILNKEKIPVYGDGQNVRDWMWVGDHVNGLVKAAACGEAGQTYNFGDNRHEVTNLDLVKQIIKTMGASEDLIEFVKDRPGHDFRYSVDSAYAESNLSWGPLKDMEQGLKETIEWYVNARESS